MFDKAAAYVESLFDDSVTIYIDADFAALSNSNTIAEAGSVKYSLSGGYSDFRTLLTSSNNSTSESIVDQLPASSANWSTDTNFSLAAPLATGANLVSLGVGITTSAQNASAYASARRRDATIRFNSNFAFDFDPTNGTATSKVDFFSTAVHEIFHAMGFTSGVDSLISVKQQGATSGQVSPEPLDFFRLKPVSDRSGTTFANAPRLLTTGANYSKPVLYDGIFSPSGITNFSVSLSTGDIPMSTGETGYGDGRQASHWKDDALIDRKIGIMDPTADDDGNSSTPVPPIVSSVRNIDQRMLGLIGWDVSGSGAVLSDAGTLAINGTSAANSIESAVSTNTSGGVTFTSAISAGSTTIEAYFNNADIGGVRYDAKGGNDTIVGSTRAETIYGGDGNDNVDANAGADTIYGGIGNDFLSGSSQSDKIYGEDGDDSLGGGNGNDSLYGGSGAELLEGGAENDFIRGDSGIDRMFGNAGDDTFDAQDSIADGLINGGTENDGAYMDDEDDQPGVITFSVGRLF